MFARFSVLKPDFDWSILRVALETVEAFMKRLETFVANHTPDPSSDDSWHGEDAIMVSRIDASR